MALNDAFYLALYYREAQRLQHTYYPLEVDHTLSLDEKFKYMEEWVTLAHDALVLVRA